MTTSLHRRSSWLASMLYKRCPDGSQYAAFILKREPHQEPLAYLYGPNVPEWLPGLITAGTGKRSPGTAYHRLVRGKYPSQKIEGREAIESLKEMMR